MDELIFIKFIDNYVCLCFYDKFYLDKILIMKRIFEYVVDIFYSRYGGGLRLIVKVLCKECVVECCCVLCLKN